MARSSTWVFTINNYTAEDIGRLASLPRDKCEVWFGEEIAPSTGTKHLQGYLESEKRLERRTVERLLGGRAWLEVTHDSEAAIGYAIKDCMFHTNTTKPEEVVRLRDVIRRAEDFGREYVWLGGVLYNAFECPTYVPERCAYKMVKHFLNLKKTPSGA